MTGEFGKRDVHGYNSQRLAETWMDDYKRLFYYHRINLPVWFSNLKSMNKPACFILLFF
jgi:hypothetical protein